MCLKIKLPHYPASKGLEKPFHTPIEKQFDFAIQIYWKFVFTNRLNKQVNLEEKQVEQIKEKNESKDALGLITIQEITFEPVPVK